MRIIATRPSLKNAHISIIIVGNDARKLVADGFPLEQVVTSDLRQGEHFALGLTSGLIDLIAVLHLPELADLGHKLFRTTQETYPIAFVPGDVFDPKHLEVVPPLASAHAASTGSPENPTQDLCSLTSLNPLHGRVSAIHASSFFDLFGEEKQLHLARALAGLLSAEPGSIICGLHVGSPVKGFTLCPAHRDHDLFCHSPESWTKLWDGLVFEKGVVTVQAKLVKEEHKEPDAPQSTVLNMLVWTVTRL